MKRIKDFLLFNFIVPFIVIFFKILGKTFHFREKEKYQESPFNPLKNENYLYGFWHSQLIGFIYHYRNNKIASIASLHRDGEIAARAAEKFGIKIVRGSSTRGGFKALLSLKKFIKSGFDVAITVDGPKGPAENVNEGILYLSKITGKKIIPVCFRCDKKIRLKSWDRLIIPLPFSRGYFIFGKSIYIPRNTSAKEMEQYKKLLKDELIRINNKGEELLYGRKL